MAEEINNFSFENFSIIASEIGLTHAERVLAANKLVRNDLAHKSLTDQVIPISFDPNALDEVGPSVRHFFQGAFASAVEKSHNDPDFEVCSPDVLRDLRELFTTARDYDQRGITWELPLY